MANTTFVWAALAAMLPGAAMATDFQRTPFGTLPDGQAVEAITLTNTHGVSARIITYGATLQALIAPDRTGRQADILLGNDDLKGFVEHPNYYGVTVGRYANRIAKGRFTLDGKTYTLATNNDANALHGGVKGFDKVNWRVVDVKRGPTATLTLAYTSADGEEGYPGKLDVTTTYTLNEAGELGIEFRAATDKPTIVNMTNHAIFNLAGEGTPGGILNHRLTIPADAFTPVDATLIPTGELKPVAGTVFDFRKGRIVGEGLKDSSDPQIALGKGYDHNFALNAGLTKEPKLAARLEDPSSGRVLEVLTTEPGVQFYTGNFLDGTLVGKRGYAYKMRDGLALEPQKFPDAPNQPKFVSARVEPGKPYRHKMIYRVSVAT